MSLKDKGFSYAAIDKALQLSGVDSQIASAQKAQYQNIFLNAMKHGDWGSAGMALANLAGIDKAGASVLGAYYPSYKDNWVEGNRRQDAKTNFGYQQRLSNQKFQQNLQSAMLNYYMKPAMEREQAEYRIGMLVKAGMNQQEAIITVLGGGRRNTTSNGSGNSGSGSTAVNKADVKWGQKVNSWYNDANEMLTAPEGASPEQIQQAAQNAEGTIANMETQVNEAIDKGDLTDNEDKTTARNMIADLRYRQAKALGDQDTAAKWFDQMTADYREKMFPDQRKWTEADQQAAEQEAEQAAAEQEQRDKSSLYAGYATHGSWY